MPKRRDGRAWSKATRAWWAALWQNPVAIMWDNEEEPLCRLALLRERFWAGVATATDATEMRQIEDRYGLNPKGLRNLRWTIVERAQLRLVAPE